MPLRPGRDAAVKGRDDRVIVDEGAVGQRGADAARVAGDDDISIGLRYRFTFLVLSRCLFGDPVTILFGTDRKRSRSRIALRLVIQPEGSHRVQEAVDRGEGRLWSVMGG